MRGRITDKTAMFNNNNVEEMWKTVMRVGQPHATSATLRKMIHSGTYRGTTMVKFLLLVEDSEGCKFPFFVHF